MDPEDSDMLFEEDCVYEKKEKQQYYYYDSEVDMNLTQEN